MSSSSRYIRVADRALLWSYSSGLCYFPGCDFVCVREANETEPSAVIGVIGHIEAHGDAGPRANPNLTDEERRSYPNLILLCPNHHEIVDTYEHTYTVEVLRRWKSDIEGRYNESLAQGMGHVTFAELEVITQALVSSGIAQDPTFTVIPPSEKMALNGLSEQTSFYMNLGLLQARQVQEYVESTSTVDRTFVNRLTTGFINEYQERRNDGYEGDSLFEALRMFSAQGRLDVRNQCAGLAVLVYLFERCEVFEH